MLSLIIAGTRTFNDYRFFRDKCNHLLKNYLKFDTGKYRYNPQIEIISGSAKGPDSMAIDYAIYNFITYKEFPAKWDDLDVNHCVIRTNSFEKKYNLLAGTNRNIEMKDYAIRNGNGALLAFFDGKSKGTSHMIEISEKAGMNVRIVKV